MNMMKKDRYVPYKQIGVLTCDPETGGGRVALDIGFENFPPLLQLDVIQCWIAKLEYYYNEYLEDWNDGLQEE